MSTFNERESAWEYALPLRVAAERAARTLDHVVEHWLTLKEDKTFVTFSAGDITLMNDLISMASDMLWNTATEFSVSTLADTTEAGTEAFFRNAELGATNREVSRLHDEIFEASRSLSPEKWACINKARHLACELSDDEAIPALKALLKECRVTA